MAGLGPAIYVLPRRRKDVDARHKAGHDGGEVSTARAADSPLMFGRMPGTMTAIIEPAVQ